MDSTMEQVSFVWIERHKTGNETQIGVETGKRGFKIVIFEDFNEDLNETS